MAWWLSWWVVLFWLWLAFAGEWNRIEWAAAAIGATAGATIAAIVRAQRELRFAFRAAWLREAVGVGTLAFALLVGPVIEASFWLLGRSPLARPGAPMPDAATAGL